MLNLYTVGVARKGGEMFKVGDLVRLKTGKSTQKVIEVGASIGRTEYIRTQYLSRLYDKDYHDSYPKWRNESDYILISENRKEPEPMAKLYETVGEPTMFGTKIATNSQGQYVLEMKGGNGEVKAYEPSDLREVLPYTVSLEPIGVNHGGNINVMAKPGQVEKDDLMFELNSGAIWRVVQLDSQCRSPKENKSKWLKLPTEAVTFGAAE